MSCRGLGGREESRLPYKVAAPPSPTLADPLCSPLCSHCKVLSRSASFRARQTLTGANGSGGAVKILRLSFSLPHLLIDEMPPCLGHRDSCEPLCSDVSCWPRGFEEARMVQGHCWNPHPSPRLGQLSSGVRGSGPESQWWAGLC